MLSVLIVCRRVDEFLLRTVKSVEALNPQILIGISATGKEGLGVRKNRLISQAAYDWALVLDTDEVVSELLLNEIESVVRNAPDNIHGFVIPYHNIAFGKKLNFGGERFSKNRLFRRKFSHILEVPIHEEVIINGPLAKIDGVIKHQSYRRIFQVLIKFTVYAWLESGEKRKLLDPLTFSKLFFYGPHMVWARAIKDEGWRDGWRGIVIALCFGYMESLTYWLLAIRNILKY